jgi:UDP-N-acetylglucosamine:LPS N-acetylglucosamine transferase
MVNKKILFICASVGLGHASRDLAITKELYKIIPDVEISWLVAPPASLFLQNAGETLLPEASQYPNETIIMENVSNTFQVNLFEYLASVLQHWAKSVEIFKEVIDKYKFDLIIGDETYQITNVVKTAIRENKPLMDIPLVAIYDFIGASTQSDNPAEIEMIKMANEEFLLREKTFDYGNLVHNFFVGEYKDLPDGALFGFPSENIRKLFDVLNFVSLGDIISFDPNKFMNIVNIRKDLGYGEEPLVICTIGGTSVGKALLELCVESYPLIKKKISDLQMILVCGPNIPLDSINVPDGIVVKGYIPDLYKHFAASDLVITQCGGSTITELIALKKNFLYFPLEKHFEQELIAERLRKNNFGVEMHFAQVTPQVLAETIVNNIGKEIDYPQIDLNGAQKAAQLIQQLLK